MATAIAATTTGPTAAGVVNAGSSASSSVSATPDVAALQAKRAQLEQQLAALQGPRSGALQQLEDVETQVKGVETQMTSLRTTLDQKNATLKQLSDQITTHEAGLGAARGQLSELLRATYEISGGDGFAGAILSANDFSSVIDRIRGAQHVTDQIKGLEQTVSDSEKSLLTERTQVQTDFAQAQTLENQLNEQDGRLLLAAAERDSAFKLLDGPARAIAQQIAQIDDQLASPAPAGPQDSSSSCGDRFAFGNCTYYVASRRCIPWSGNAADWWPNARAYGYGEGQVPQRGAVAVWGRGGYSPVGHVAYVEAVGPAPGVPAGSFLISEMNFVGFDRVDYRVVHDGAAGLLGFIYGKAG